MCQCVIEGKEPAVVAGLELAQKVFERFDPRIGLECLVEDGDLIDGARTRIALVNGPAGSILTAERLVLNLMQRMSGVATLTRKYAQLVKPHGIQILDTRKTTPGMRQLQKEAVRIGGGTNHRFGLYDAILIKDNHVKIAGGVAQAIKLAKIRYPDKRVEVEVTNLDEVKQALEQKADAILLDNMAPQMVNDSVALIDGKAFIEVSGGITLDTISAYFIKGVDAISCGALTHSAANVDMSLEVEKYYE
jgi:nicotinate-nucleotide pyrophosphorylase (carboxylating)